MKKASFVFEKNQVIGSIIPGLIHEINNPLTFLNSNNSSLLQYFSVIKEYIELLEKNSSDLDDEKKQEILQFKSDKNIDFLLEDITDILDECSEGLQRIQKIVSSMKNMYQTSSEQQFDSVDLNDLLSNLVVLTRNEIKYHANVNFKSNDLPMIQCNSSLLSWILFKSFLTASQLLKIIMTDDVAFFNIQTKIESDNVLIQIDFFNSTLDSVDDENTILEKLNTVLMEKYRFVFEPMIISQELKRCFNDGEGSFSYIFTGPEPGFRFFLPLQND